MCLSAPLSVSEVQALLGSREALILILDTPPEAPLPEETFVWVITKTDSRWVRSQLGTKALSDSVAALRCGLDQELWEVAESAQNCRKELGPSLGIEAAGRAQVLPFDLARAHELYEALLGTVDDVIRDKHLLIVPSGALTSLPFNVLLTEPSKLPIGAPTLADYRNAAWLGARQPITVLPSVGSLKALRQFAKTSRATRAYLGIGNPLLDGPDVRDAGRAALSRKRQACPESASELAALTSVRPTATFTRLFRGGIAEIEGVRALPPLPETADELCEVGRHLGVPQSEILLGARATETALKALSNSGRLADYAIVHFATHGALTGQVQGSAEPGLVLTPPQKGTIDPKALERDDGFLTASEIATLRLDADWVILSACNTRSGRKCRGVVGAGARLFLCRSPRPAGLTLGGWFRRHRQTYHQGVRRTQI
jgi:CHAT domain-containing protein